MLRDNYRLYQLKKFLFNGNPKKDIIFVISIGSSIDQEKVEMNVNFARNLLRYLPEPPKPPDVTLPLNGEFNPLATFTPLQNARRTDLSQAVSHPTNSTRPFQSRFGAVVLLLEHDCAFYEIHAQAHGANFDKL